MYAQAHQPSADTLKAEARNFAKIIRRDKRKSQTYCKIVELNDQIDEKEDPIDARKLKKKRDKLEEKLGRKYIALVAGVMNIDRDSRDYRAIASILEPLDKLCTAIKNQHRRRTREEHRRRVPGEWRKRDNRARPAVACRALSPRRRRSSGPDQAARLQRPRFLNSGRSNLGLTSTLSVPRSPASSMPSQRRAMPSQNSRSVLSEARSASPLHFLICS